MCVASANFIFCPVNFYLHSVKPAGQRQMQKEANRFHSTHCVRRYTVFVSAATETSWFGGTEKFPAEIRSNGESRSQNYCQQTS
jgi:hypothetical protein